MMDYGPNWPPRPAAPRGQRKPSFGERAAFSMLVAALMMLGCWTLWRQTSIPLDLPANPPTTYATTTVHPVAGGGHPRHQPRR